jgi:hypothetical protein
MITLAVELLEEWSALEAIVPSLSHRIVFASHDA